MNVVPQSASSGFYTYNPDATGQVFAYSFGPGISVSVANQKSNLQTKLSTVSLGVSAQTSVNPGLYNLTVVNEDCSVVIYPNAIQVVPAGS